MLQIQKIEVEGELFFRFSETSLNESDMR